MLVLIGSDGKSMDSAVAKRFGHANYFILYNTDSKIFEALENIEPEHDHKNLEDFINKGVESFIVGNVGPHAFETIDTPNSKVYLARKMSVQESIEKFVKGGLRHLTEPTMNKSIAHEHHHRHNH